jgi:hypothetical protein
MQFALCKVELTGVAICKVELMGVALCIMGFDGGLWWSIGGVWGIALCKMAGAWRLVLRSADVRQKQNAVGAFLCVLIIIILISLILIIFRT